MHFSDYFKVPPEVLDDYGAFNVSLTTDLPLFIDPFLLFASSRDDYQDLHSEIIRYLEFLRDKAEQGGTTDEHLQAWYCFPEVSENWLGFTKNSNRGRGLGRNFASIASSNMHLLFRGSAEGLCRSLHLEKLCLIAPGVGRDFISDFTTNLIKNWLARYTSDFAKEHCRPEDCREFSVPKCRFDYTSEAWIPERHLLPRYHDSFVLLTPTDILTKDEAWINRSDMVGRLPHIATSLPDGQLRAQLDNYIKKALSRKKSQRERNAAATDFIAANPAIIDHYIRHQEDREEEARRHSYALVESGQQAYVDNARDLTQALSRTAFYKDSPTSYEACCRRVLFLKDVVENKGGHRLFYVKGRPIEREEDLHIMYRLTWHDTAYDVTREANDGRGPADFKVSRGSRDKAIVEFKLASNSHLRRNLQKQAEIYQKASDAGKCLKVIFYFSAAEHRKVTKMLQEPVFLGMPDVVLVDARKDNKPSGSKA